MIKEKILLHFSWAPWLQKSINGSTVAMYPKYYMHF
jgi:hypothetical protein